MKIAWLVLRRTLQVFLISALSVMVLCLLVVGGAYLQVTEHFKGKATLPADCALVFGAAVAGNQPGPAITRRVSTAAALYRAKKVTTLFLSGGRGEGNRQSEALVMKREALKQGVDEKDIVLEDQSHSTWENILYSKNLTSHCSSVVGISDGYHLARIELIAKRQGWGELQTFPSDIRPPTDSELKSVHREVFAYVFYLLRLDHWMTTDALLERLSDEPEMTSIQQKILQML
jgi:vancomycin permeability regulator SanA